MRVPYAVQALLLVVGGPFQKKHIANVCGHETHKKGFMCYGKSTIIWELPFAENGHPDYCLKCVEKMSIQCAWCGEPIITGSPITSYRPKKEFRVPDYAVKYDNGDNQDFVGCFRVECVDPSLDLAGYWMPPGVTKRVTPPYELRMMSGNTFVVDDLWNYPVHDFWDYPVSVSPIDINS